MRKQILLYINGQSYKIADKSVFMMLADFLRLKLRLTGTKIVCAEGDCGACTVLCYRSKGAKTDNFWPINACIVPIFKLDGCHLLTVEGLNQKNGLSAVQQAIVDHHGSQCGYCTPGFVMAMTALFQEKKTITQQKVKNALTGNLCRCTGYQPLIEAALAVDQGTLVPLDRHFLIKESVTELMNSQKHPVHITNDQWEFFAPTQLKEALSYKQTCPDACVMAGATDLGVMINKGKKSIGRLLSLHLIDELYDITEIDGQVRVGALVTLAQLRHFAKTALPKLASFLNLFASPQIKNMATLIGNVTNGSPIGDMLPFLMVADGQIHIKSLSDAKKVPMEKFYLGYKKLALDACELVTHISFTLPPINHILSLNKISQRKDLDISTINSAFLFDIGQQLTINKARIAFGGVAPMVVRLFKAEKFLAKKTLSEPLVETALTIIQQEISPQNDLRGGAAYRRVLAENLFRSYCKEIMAHDHRQA